MPNLVVPNLAWLQGLTVEGDATAGPRLFEMVQSLQAAINNLGAQTVAAPVGTTGAPPQISALNVTAGDNGVYDVQIQDNNPVSRGINYFVEYSENPNFDRPTVVHLGPSRNGTIPRGNQNLYWRAYSQYPTSEPSKPVYFGTSTSPTVVSGGGTATGPTPQVSTGSGTAQNTGREGGAGFGFIPSRGVKFANEN